MNKSAFDLLLQNPTRLYALSSPHCFKEGYLNSKKYLLSQRCFKFPRASGPSPGQGGKEGRYASDIVFSAVCDCCRSAMQSWKTPGSCCRQRISRRVQTTLKRGNAPPQRGQSFRTPRLLCDTDNAVLETAAFTSSHVKSWGGMTEAPGESRAKMIWPKPSSQTQTKLQGLRDFYPVSLGSEQEFSKSSVIQNHLGGL